MTTSRLPATLIVIAKEPRPGFSKTRLCPPCTPAEAAAIAEAALRDTLTTALESSAKRLLLALDGKSPNWLDPRFDVVPQPSGGLDERLAKAFEDASGPALLIGMDTPQVSAELLDASLKTLLTPGCDAVLGHAPDGGYWAIGLRQCNRSLFIGVPMSMGDTGSEQEQRLRDAGLATTLLPELTDVDTFDEALQVAAQVPNSRFAAAVSEVNNKAARGA